MTNRKEEIKKSLKKDFKENVISLKEMENIKKKVRYNDEGFEAIADFTYDSMISKKESYEDMYKDYRD
ncbi:MAG: hypothetical protein IJN90_00585 [Bacilli bacterium]|nr:hypothetical protein [Bacilli bacterium]